MRDSVNIDLSTDQATIIITALWGNIETIRCFDISDADKIEQICDVSDTSHSLMMKLLEELTTDKKGGIK